MATDSFSKQAAGEDGLGMRTALTAAFVIKASSLGVAKRNARKLLICGEAMK